MLGFGALGASALGQLPRGRFVEPLKLVSLRGYLPNQSLFNVVPPLLRPQPHQQDETSGFVGQRIVIVLSGNMGAP